MNYILFDDENIRQALFPFTLSRPIAEIRAGILTLREKWEMLLKEHCYSQTISYLQEKYQPLPESSEGVPVIYINSSLFPSPELLESIKQLPQDSALHNENTILAVSCSSYQKSFRVENHKFNSKKFLGTVSQLQKPWEIFSNNAQNIQADFDLLTIGRKSATIDSSNKVIGSENIFIEEGAGLQCCIINASTGPVYIGKFAEVMEGCMIRGPFALGEHAVLKMGSKIYGPTTIGPECKVGGEVNNSVIFGYSNKAHDGFLGNSVIGEWCNLGADTNNSNLKNNYGQVKIWNMAQDEWQSTGLQFCGLMMGDHSKSGINTMFNTGTVVGFSANIFDGGFPPKFIKSYSWGGQSNATKFELEKAIEVATKVFERRKLNFSDADRKVFEYLYAH